MAASARFRLKQGPTDVWSTRERLALACSVMRSGDQNWVSVSRAIKPFAEPNRQSDWFSQKNCALQYSELLEKVETPKRKRGEREVTETPGDVIVRKLTIERIEELKRIVQEEQHKYRRLKREVEAARSGQTDDRLKEIWEGIQSEQKAAEEASAAAQKLAAEIASKAQGKTQNKPVATPSRPKKVPPTLKLKIEALMEADDNTQDSTASVAESTITSEEDSNQTVVTATLSAESLQSAKVETPGDVKPKPTPPPSPLLSSLLQNNQALLEALQKQQQQAQVAPLQPAENATETGGSVDEKTEPQTVEAPPAPPAQVKQEAPPQVKQEPLAQQDSDGGTKVAAVDTPQTVTPLKVDETPKTETKESVDVEVDVVTKVDEPPTLVQVEKEATTGTETPKSREEEKEELPLSPPSIPVSAKERQKEKEKEEKTAESMDEETLESIASPPLMAPELSPPRPSASGKGKGPLLNLRPPTMDMDEPASPASSVVSNDTEDMVTAKVKVTHRNKGGRPRGRKSRRLTRSKLVVNTQEDEKKELETSSRVSEEQDSTDDEVLLLDPDSHLHSTKLPASVSESFPNSPASITHSDTEDERAHKTWKKSIMLVWRSAANHKYANVFLHPVTEDIAPGYRSVVFRPMNLSTIKKNIETGEVRTTAEFQRDMMLMFTNAIMYNNSDHNVYHMAVEMYNDVMVHIEQYVNTQMMVQTETKVLRTSRRSDVTAVSSDKEEDSKKKRNPQDHDTIKIKKRKI